MLATLGCADGFAAHFGIKSKDVNDVMSSVFAAKQIVQNNVIWYWFRSSPKFTITNCLSNILLSDFIRLSKEEMRYKDQLHQSDKSSGIL